MIAVPDYVGKKARKPQDSKALWKHQRVSSGQVSRSKRLCKERRSAPRFWQIQGFDPALAHDLSWHFEPSSTVRVNGSNTRSSADSDSDPQLVAA